MAVEVVRLPHPRPPNSVLLSLDGTEEDVYHDYLRCQDHFRDWNIARAIMCEGKVLFEVLTTPTSSTFYYAMTYKGRQLVFVIEGRNGWMHGYYAVEWIDGYPATKGIYEFQNRAQAEHFMNHTKCKRLPFEGNHNDISSGSIGQTSIGLDALRNAFDTIWAYNGDTQPDDFNKAFGIIVVHICESMKLKPLFARICEAFEGPSVRKLDKNGQTSLRDFITKWSKLSGKCMHAIDDPNYEIKINEFPNIRSEQDILTYLTVLFIDGYFKGKFEHDVAKSPRHWEPLECGNNGVQSVDDTPYLEKHTDDDDGGSDRDWQNGQSGGKQKREGDRKGRHHGDKKGKRGGGKEEQGERWGGGRKRGEETTNKATGFPLIGVWSGGKGKELSMNPHPIGSVMQLQGLVCKDMLICEPAGMSIMEESKYQRSQIIQNCSLTAGPSFDVTNSQRQDLGAMVMTHIGNLKDGILGGNPPLLDNNGNSSNPVSNPPSYSRATQKDSSTTVKVSGAEAECVIRFRKQLGGATVMSSPLSSSNLLMITPPDQIAAMLGSGVGSTPAQSQTLNPDKLPPVQALTSIRSSLAAEQAASINGGLPSGEFFGGSLGFQIAKRRRVERTTHTSDMGAPCFFWQAPQVQQQIGAVPTLGGTPPPGLFPPPPPQLPSVLPQHLQQFGQSTGGTIGMGGPFGMAPPLQRGQRQPQQQQCPQAPEQLPMSTGFSQSSGTEFFPLMQVQQSPSAQ